MDMIWMQHPQLPPDQLICEPVESRIGLEMCGWRETDPPPPPEELSFGEEEPGPLELDSDDEYEAAVESRPDSQTELDGKEN